MLTVKESNHKIRSRDLLLSLMCYALCSGSENYNHIETGSVESVCIINLSMDVVARVDRRFDSSTILGLSTFFHTDLLR